MNRRVRPDGRTNAPIVLWGEAPGKEEVRRGRPFVGPSGYLMQKDWWDPNRLSRSMFRIYNVFEYMCPQSNITKAPKPEVEMWASTVHTRMLETSPKIVVPTGNIALRSLMRQPLWSPRSPKITDWRGSLLTYEFDDGRTCKMIPVVHPAAVMRDMSQWKLCAADWARVATEVSVPDLNLPVRTHHLYPDCGPKILARYLNAAQEEGLVMAGDIETPRRTKGGPRHIECMAFSYNKGESLTLRYPEDRKYIEELNGGRCIKVGQNYNFDRFWLASEGIHILGTVHDLLNMHHAFDCTLPHSLAAMASLYTRQPYWKKSAKDLDLDDVETTPRAQLMAYCGLDACVTIELFDILYDMLEGALPC